jgi:hypothetical protein
MNTEFIAILQKLVCEQGKEALFNPTKCKAFLADYTHGEYKKESRLLLQALEAGAQKAIDATDELEICKKQQARVLQEEYFLATETAADVVDTLAIVLRGGNQRKKSNSTLCTNCGKELQNDWVVCPYCGTPVKQIQQNQPQSETVKIEMLPLEPDKTETSQIEPPKAKGPEVEANEYSWTYGSSGWAAITKYNGLKKNIIIPSHIQNMLVISIEDNAFRNCTSLASVTIPDSVRSIGKNAFSGCTSLNITWYYNPVLKSASFRNYLKSVIIPDGVTSIGDRAFYGCNSLAGVTIPNSIASIEDYAFSRCISFTNIIIPDSVTNIGQYAFAHCTSLTSVTIGNGVTSIGFSVFSDCPNLTSVIIPDCVTSIGHYAFHNCTSLTSVTIPNGVTSIGDYGFSVCVSLTSVIIPDSVTSIGSGNFSGCTGLTSVIIPDSVTSIGPYAFRDCTSLTSVTFQGTIIERLIHSSTFDRMAFYGLGDLYDKFYATDKTKGMPGTYTRPNGSSEIWTKQP